MATLNAFQTLDIISSKQMNTLLGLNMFKRSFLVENYIRFNEKLRADCADIIFIAECMSKNPYIVLMALPFCLEITKIVKDLPSTWEVDFKTYAEQIDELLYPIAAGDVKDKLKFQFLKEYWR